MMNNIPPNRSNKNTQLIIACCLSFISFVIFLVKTGIVQNSIVMSLIALFFIYPFRKNSKIANNIFICILVVFLGWILFGLGSQLAPFILAILVGYFLDPLVTKLEKKGLKRWISALIVVVVASVIVIIGCIYIIPIIIDQSQTILKNTTLYIQQFSQYLQSDDFVKLLEKFNLPANTIEVAITNEILPRIETILSTIFSSLLKIFSSISNIANYIISLIVFPILVFYFLKDFGKFKIEISWMIKEEYPTVHHYLERFDDILRTYIGWILTTSTIVFILGSISFSIFDLPYGVLLALIAGLLNPIPYFGSMFSMIIGSLILIFVQDGNVLFQITILITTILCIHFLNAYLLEPTIAGNKVGLHPVLMILAVFIFLSLFGVLGMLIAVPITSIIVLILKEKIKERFYQKVKIESEKDLIVQNNTTEAITTDIKDEKTNNK